MIQWNELTPRERDEAVADAFAFGIKTASWLEGDARVPIGLKHYTTDANDVRLVEDAIAARNLQYQYMNELVHIATSLNINEFARAWQLIRSTPEQRCIAALRTIGVVVVAIG